MIQPTQQTKDTRRPADQPTGNDTTERTREPESAAEAKLMRTLGDYLRPADVAAVAQALAYARELARRQSAARETSGQGAGQAVAGADPADLAYVIDVAQTLAETLHIDAVTLVAVTLAQAVERGDADLAAVRARLGEPLGEQVAQTIAHIEQFDTLQRPAAALRRQAQRAAGAETPDRARRRSQERRRQQDADGLRKMFVGMAEDPRVVVIKIADHLRLMRSICAVADGWRAAPTTAPATTSARSDAPPQWTLEECRQYAEETRTLYAPLAGRLGMGRVEGELEDLAFAILQPDEYQWLRDAVAVETNERRSYVDRVSDILRGTLAPLGLTADVSGRVKHLYSIYKKVVRSGSRDLSQLYDILAFRIIVPTVDDCYLALSAVHELWRPMTGRYKDFIASPKVNGYQSLHTTVFCLDDQLAEIQIRTRAMHQMAEYGVAMHWYYKDVGDTASAKAKPLQSWAQQVMEWQQELQDVVASGSGEGRQPGVGEVGSEVGEAPTMQEQIFVFTPAGDVKDLPAGATPLDFAYRVHTNLGDHVSGARITQDDGGRPVKRLVPLDYELRNGDVIEIIKRNDAHPTRDWLRVVKTKLARNRILRYLKVHARDVDIQVGRERLDRELRSVGLRRGYDELGEDDLAWLVREFKQSDTQSLLAAIGSGRVRVSAVTAKAHERLRPPAPADAAPTETPPATAPLREVAPLTEMSVAGMEGLLTRLASCCNPLPGDQLLGFITRGRGVVIHRADCPNVKSLLARNPERGVAVSWPATLDESETLRAPIIVEAGDRTALLRDVTAVISGLKINMIRVDVNTNPRTHQATINAILEIHRAEQLDQALNELRAVPTVISAERKEPRATPARKGARAAKTGKVGKGRTGAGG
ncbi:MAG TPA: TGS domain-containing protein [Ktedonobacterales bacterium]|nr:TGS domain-containing protein [Ktedonobacterales bacterium]